MNLKYTCSYCNATNKITNFIKWFVIPHFGSKKLIKCRYCKVRNFMKRQNWYGPSWLDWPTNSK